MLFEELSNEETRLISDCLSAAVDGPFFPEWEFHTLFGLDRGEMRQVIGEWPNASDVNTSFRAIVGALNNLLGSPHGYDLRAVVGHSAEDLKSILIKLANDERYS